MNEKRFDGKGKIYAQARPHYPTALFDRLQKEGIVTAQSVVADVGAGTGIFSRQLRTIAARVYAVEPNASMRAAAENACRGDEGIVSINASAEHTGLPAGAVDCVTAAQAFHWFDRDAFCAECRRILRPSGHVVLVWNDRDESAPVIQEHAKVNARWCAGYRGFTAGADIAEAEQFMDFFRGAYAVWQFENEVCYDLDGLIRRSLSSSYAPREGDAAYQPYVEAITDLFRQYGREGWLRYPYITRCYVGQV